MRTIKAFRNSKLQTQLGILLVLVIIVLLSSILIYSIFVKNILLKKEKTYLHSTLAQISNNVEGLSSKIKMVTEILLYNHSTGDILKPDEPLDKFNDNAILSSIVANISLYNSNILNISLVDRDFNILGFNRKYLITADYLEANYKFSDPESQMDLFTGYIPKTSDGGGNCYCYIRSVMNQEIGAEVRTKIGTYLVFCNIKPLQVFLDQISLTQNSVFLILDSKNELITASNNLQEGQDKLRLMNELKAYLPGSDQNLEIKTLLGKDFLVMYQQLPQTGWKVVGIAPVSEINSDVNFLMILGTIFSSLMCLALLLMGLQMLHGIMRPIGKIVLFMEKGAHYGLHNRLQLEEKNEIGQLCIHINGLLDEIDSVIRTSFANQSRMYEAELSKHKAEFAALQSQINPHFLYNTLNCIKGYGHLLGSNEIVKISTDLSALLRYSIKGPEEVRVEEEIKCISRYLDIIAIRYPGRYRIEYNIDPGILHFFMFRFLLQPIVENAIYHGMEPKNKNGVLEVNGFIEEGNTLCFQVADNGVGMRPEKLQEINEQLQYMTDSTILTFNSESGIGILNIAQRIKLKYGSNYGLSLSANPQGGLTVTIKIPAKENPQNESTDIVPG